MSFGLGNSDIEIDRKIVAILDILHRGSCSLGSRNIGRELKKKGIELNERTIRYYLKIMDERGLTICLGRNGRIITERGIKELHSALVTDKIAFVESKIDTLSYQMDFDLSTKKGRVILNISFIQSKDLKKAKKIIKDVIDAGICTSSFVTIKKSGEKIGDMTIPEGMAGIGTICSITLNGIFMRKFIPISSKFGGLLEIRNGNPLRFTEVVSYSGSSIDPTVIFIKSKMTSVTNVVKTGNGVVLGGYREIPLISIETVEKIKKELEEIGISGIVSLGGGSSTFLGIPLTLGKAGMVIYTGLNPIAAVEEKGINTINYAISTVVNFSELNELK